MHAMCQKILYVLAVLVLNQALIGNSGTRWVLAEYDELVAAVREKDLYALGFLALVHAHGDKGMDISYEDSMDFAEEAASKNHWLGHFAMGYLARFVPYGPDPEKVRKHYLQAFQDPDGRLVKEAAQGDPVAAYCLAEIFTSDEVRPNVIPDLKLAANYYQISSSQGYSPAAVQLALFKLHSIADPSLGITKDLPGGIDLLKKAASKNLPSAHHYLGRSYFKGIGVESDKDMALVHFQAAADRGKAISQLLVADFYAYGICGPVKLDLALRYARLASFQEEEKAMLKINEYQKLQMQESDPKPREESQPEKNQFSQVKNIVPPLPSPELPPPPPMPSPEPLPSVYEPPKSLAPSPPELPTQVVLDRPDFVEQKPGDLVKAAKSAYWGKDEPLNLVKAHNLFIEAAEAGDGESARYLGMMYMQGKGVEKDPQQALDWFEIAAQRGDSMAKSNLLRLQGLLNSK